MSQLERVEPGGRTRTRILLLLQLVACILGVGAAVVSVWVFYLNLQLGIPWSYFDWMPRQPFLFSWWPRDLTPVNQPGALAALLAVFLFVLAFLGRSMSLRTELPQPPVWRPASWFSRNRRFPPPSAVLFSFGLTGCLGLLSHQAVLVFGGTHPSILLWSGCLLLAILTALAWDWPQGEDLGRTGADLLIGLGMFLVLLGVAPTMGLRWQGFVLLAVGSVLFAAGAREGHRFGTSVSWREHLGVLLLAVAVLSFAMSRATSWQFACEGDEWNFYSEPRNILLGLHPNYHPLSVHRLDFVSKTFAVGLTAICMKLAGMSLLGWRMSSVLPFVLGLAPVYYFLRWLFDRGAAALGTAFLAASYVLHNFSLIGYNNTHGLIPVTFGLGAFAFASVSRGLTRYVLAGAAFGSMFLVYAVGRVIAIPMVLLFVFVTWRFRAVALTSCVAAALGFLTVAAPTLFSPIQWESLVTITTPVGTAPVGYGKDPLSAGQIAHNATNALFLFLTGAMSSHHIHGPHADPVTAVLVLIGYGFLIAQAWRHRVAWVWLVAAVLFALLVGGHQQYPFIKNTRTFILVPMNSILAGVGGAALIHLLVGRRRKLSLLLGGVLVVSVLVGNVFYAQRVVAPRSGGHPIAQLVRQFQETAAEDGGGMPIFLIWDEQASFGLTIARAHEVGFERMVHLLPDEVAESDVLVQARGRPGLVLIPAFLPDKEKLFAVVESQWPDAEREEVHIGDSPSVIFYRYVTPSGREELAKPPSQRRSLRPQTTIMEVPRVACLAADGLGRFCALSPTTSAAYWVHSDSRQKPVSLVPKGEWTSLVLSDAQMVVGVAVGPDPLRWYDRDGVAVRRLGQEKGVTAIASLVDWPGRGIVALGSNQGELWSVSADGDVARLPLPAERGIRPTAIAPGPEGTLWISSADGRIVELGTDGTVRSERPFPTLKTTFAVLPDRSIVYPDPLGRRILQRNLTGELRHAFAGFGQPRFVALSPRNRLMVADAETNVAVIYPPAEELGLLSTPEAPAGAAAADPAS